MSSRPRVRKAKRQRALDGDTSNRVALKAVHARVLLVLLIAGFAFGVYLTYVHYRLRAEPGWRSACDVDITLSCDEAALSPFGSIVGLPLSLLGAWFYLIAGAIVFAPSPWRLFRSPAFVLFIGGALAIATSVALATISILSIGSICPICVAMYVINIAMTVVAWNAVRSSGETIVSSANLERTHWRARRAALAVAALSSLLALVSIRAIYARSAGGSQICEAVANSATSDRSIELVIYSDFQCPHCRDVARSIHPILRDQKGAIHVVSRTYPLDTACNQHVTSSRHTGSCRLALATECADAQGKITDLSDALYEDGVPSDIESLAVSLGLEGKAFQACMKSERTISSLRAKIDEAAALGVRATPTMLVDGARHIGRLDGADLRCLETAASWTR